MCVCVCERERERERERVGGEASKKRYSFLRKNRSRDLWEGRVGRETKTNYHGWSCRRRREYPIIPLNKQ